MTDAAEEAKVTEATAVQAYQYFRDICSWRLLNMDSPIILGGPGVIVQIDESLFRHKPKVDTCVAKFLNNHTLCTIHLCYHRIIVAVHQRVRSGFLGCVPPPKHQDWE